MERGEGRIRREKKHERSDSVTEILMSRENIKMNKNDAIYNDEEVTGNEFEVERT